MKELEPINLVLCEGRDDQRVMAALAEHEGIANRLQFEHYAESGTLAAHLLALSNRAEFRRGQVRSLLVTRDADDNPESRWISVRDAVSRAFGVDLTDPGRWAETPAVPRVAAWVNPGPGQPGMIETLCLEAARGAEPDIFPCIDDFMRCIKEASGTGLHEKARFHIWSIVAQGPGAQDRLSLEAALAHLTPDWTAPVFDGLRKALREAAE